MVMGRQAGRALQQRAVQTRSSILHAAAEVFDEHGFVGASIMKICERGETTQGAIYFHFKSKEGLAREVMNAQSDVILPRLASEGLQRLVDITLLWSRQLQNDPLLRAGVRLTNEQHTFGLNEETPYRTWAAIMKESLEAARTEGELLKSVDTARIAEFVVAACTGLQMYSNVVCGRTDLTERTVEMWQFMLPGIAVPQIVAAVDVSLERVARLAAA
ncbi:ScbR family autoregulator-binding transcription factor [Streptomyces sp. H27-C3]|uniref:ScbR family autoregulator-binding transcription factor n=1 Tax=Streptomyces sp. H27-C3 TaxID=3046305 RepID=UPI0024BA08C4|nr:ScbR family autoregulator-binding transcription factor [Streptomyces sp. H27-C3]MDJ0466758.1 ScbR family autoregulator-binding transcription factor [Streptomyces sp. H27-C3]